jgi:hypothetical protein
VVGKAEEQPFQPLPSPLCGGEYAATAWRIEPGAEEVETLKI